LHADVMITALRK